MVSFEGGGLGSTISVSEPAVMQYEHTNNLKVFIMWESLGDYYFCTHLMPLFLISYLNSIQLIYML